MGRSTVTSYAAVAIGTLAAACSGEAARSGSPGAAGSTPGELLLAAPTVEVVATFATTSLTFATDGTTLYYDPGGTMASVPIAGGATTTIDTSSSQCIGGGACGLICFECIHHDVYPAVAASAGGFAYVFRTTHSGSSSNGWNYTVQGTGFSLQNYELDDAQPDVAASGSYAYFDGNFDYACGFSPCSELMRVDFATGSVTTLLGQGWSTGAMTVGERHVIGGNPLVKCSRTGCTRAAPLFAATGFTVTSSLTARGGNVYWWGADGAGHTGVFSCGEDGCLAPTFLGPSTAQAPAVEGIAAGTKSLLWLEADGTVQRCPLTGCVASPRVVVPAVGGTNNWGLVRAGAHVYWAQSNGSTTSVLRILSD